MKSWFQVIPDIRSLPRPSPFTRVSHDSLASSSLSLSIFGVSASVSIHSVGSGVSGDEEDKDEDEELAHDDDDEQDVDEMNHTRCPKETVRTHSPNRRTRGDLVCQHLKRITKYKLSDRYHEADNGVAGIRKKHEPGVRPVSSESVGNTMSGPSDSYGTCCRCRHLEPRCSRTGTAESLRVFRSKNIMTDLLDDDMFKVYLDMSRSETLRIQ